MKKSVATHKIAQAVSIVLAIAIVGPAQAAGGGEGVHIEHNDWPFAGFYGQFDTQQLQRGFQVYQQVCAACHGLSRVRFRNLTEPGGPKFPVEAVKVLAASWPYTVAEEFDTEGKMVERLPTMADPIVGPYKSDEQAREAQNDRVPPDLSLITSARSVENHAPWYLHIPQMAWDIVTGYQEGGADYLTALLLGYKDEPPAGFELGEGLYYNAAFPGHQLGMPPPLSKDNFIEYQEDAGAKGSLQQNARDVTAFLVWAADPNLDARKRLGWQVMVYLLITTVLLYLAKKHVWSRLKAKPTETENA